MGFSIINHPFGGTPFISIYVHHNKCHCGSTPRFQTHSHSRSEAWLIAEDPDRQPSIFLSAGHVAGESLGRVHLLKLLQGIVEGCFFHFFPTQRCFCPVQNVNHPYLPTYSADPIEDSTIDTYPTCFDSRVMEHRNSPMVSLLRKPPLNQQFGRVTARSIIFPFCW